MTENTEGTPPREVVQLAMLMQAKDSRAWGITEDHGVTYHPTWDEQGLIGQQEYLRDAEFLVDAMRLLRWGPLDERDRARETAARLEEELAWAEARITAALACYGPSTDLPLGVSRWRSADAFLAAVRKELTAERVPS